jgi:hypothetical protein
LTERGTGGTEVVDAASVVVLVALVGWFILAPRLGVST